MAGAVAMAMWQLKTAVALDVWSPGSGPYCFEVAATPTAFALSAANGNLRVYRYGARGIELVHEFVQTNYVRVNDIAFDRQTPTLLWSAGADGCVRSWDTRSGRPAQCFSGPLARGRPIWCPICPRTHPCRLGPFKHTFTAPRWSICMSGVWPRTPPPRPSSQIQHGHATTCCPLASMPPAPSWQAVRRSPRAAEMRPSSFGATRWTRGAARTAGGEAHVLQCVF